jgi:hypothetical protein
MPSVALEVESTRIATICCDDFHIVTVRVTGARVEDTFATLEMTASKYPEGTESTYLTWVHDYSLRPGQRVTVRFMEAGETTGEGKTIDDLYPGEAQDQAQDLKTEAECFQELRALPNVRAGYNFWLSSPAQPSYRGATNSDEHAFSFHLLWNCVRPDRANVFLGSYTIDSVEKRTPSREHAHEYISAGESAALQVDA